MIGRRLSRQELGQQETYLKAENAILRSKLPTPGPDTLLSDYRPQEACLDTARG